MAHMISNIADLEALYGEVNPNSLRKEVPSLTPEYRRLMAASPFCAVATSGPAGIDCSPRGDPAGFVRVLDDSTVAVPDRRGNNRLDTLRNIVVDPRIALLFLIPGVNETLRINGTAQISTEPTLLQSFSMDGSAPRDSSPAVGKLWRGTCRVTSHRCERTSARAHWKYTLLIMMITTDFGSHL